MSRARGMHLMTARLNQSDDATTVVEITLGTQAGAFKSLVKAECHARSQSPIFSHEAGVPQCFLEVTKALDIVA